MDKPRITLAAHVNALSIALVYATFAGMWILLSDKAVAWLFSDPHYHLFASTLKGSLFVAVTAMLLYFLVRRLSGAEDRLRALKMLAAFADNTEDIIYALDQDRRFILVNRVAERVTGKTMAELLGSHESTLFPPDVAARIEADNLWVLEHGCSRTFEETLPLAGGPRTLLTTKCPLHDESGEIIGLLGVAHDITERKKAETALAQATDDLAATLRAIPDLLFEVDETGRYIKVETTAQNLLAAPADRLLGRTVSEMLPPDAARIVLDALANAARTDTDFGRRITLPLADGPHHFELSVARKGMGAHPLQHFIVLSRDITDRQESEDELLRRNDELERFNIAGIGRELDMVELKKQVNALSLQLGLAAPYSLRFLDELDKQA